MSDNKIDPETKKVIWQIIVYVVTVLASFFGGNAAASANIINLFNL